MGKLVRGLALFFSLVLALVPARALAQAIGPPATILCNKSAAFTGTGAAAIAIATVSGTIVNVCGWHTTNTAATGTFDITYGTGAGCGTGTVDVTGTLSVTNTAPSSDHIDFAMFSTPVGGQVCVNATATVKGVLWYSQF